MQKNVGGYDRIARLVAGPVLVLVGLAGVVGGVSLALGPIPALLVAVLALLVGAVFVVTGLTQKCPLNSALGVNTYRAEAASGEVESAPTR